MALDRDTVNSESKLLGATGPETAGGDSSGGGTGEGEGATGATTGVNNDAGDKPDWQS